MGLGGSAELGSTPLRGEDGDGDGDGEAEVDGDEAPGAGGADGPFFCKLSPMLPGATTEIFGK
jgi:hypothetical protein